MRIAIFTDNFYPEISGITDSIMLLSRELGRRGHHVGIFAPKYTRMNYLKAKVDISEPDLGNTVSVFRMRSIHYPNSPTGQGRIVLPTLLRSRMLKKFKPDIIHLHSPFGVGLEGLAAAKRMKLPIVGTNHTPVEEFMKYSPINSRVGTKFAQKYFVWFYNKCRFITAPSNSVLWTMESVGLKVPHRQLSNPLDLNHYTIPTSEEKSALKNKHGISGKFILYTGRLAPEKHVDEIIKGFAKIIPNYSDATLGITGHGTSETSLKELAQSLGISNKVVFLGFVSEEALSELNKAADVFVMMSTAETQSLSLMHAMSAGVPPIVANARALPEYVSSDRGFVVPIGDISALADRIMYLLSHPEEAKQIGVNAHNFVQQFSIEKITSLWETIYHNNLQ